MYIYIYIYTQTHINMYMHMMQPIACGVACFQSQIAIFALILYVSFATSLFCKGLLKTDP